MNTCLHSCGPHKFAMIIFSTIASERKAEKNCLFQYQFIVYNYNIKRKNISNGYRQCAYPSWHRCSTDWGICSQAWKNGLSKLYSSRRRILSTALMKLHTCSIGFISGEREGRRRVFKPSSCYFSVTTADWVGALSSCRMKFWPFSKVLTMKGTR